MIQVYISLAISFGIAYSAAFLNGYSMDWLIFFISFFACFIAFFQDRSILFTLAKFLTASILIFFFPIPGAFYLAAVAIPYLTKEPVFLALQGLLIPLFALSLRGGEILFTRETISFALTIFGAFLIKEKPNDPKVAYSGLVLSVLASATLKTFMFLFPAQIIMLFALTQTNTQAPWVTSIIYLIVNSLGGLFLYLVPILRMYNDKLIKWLMGG